ncbi:ImmA/IrrE family metallo-endopeptidase [Microbacterium dauci]|uniref:ImmA/IrrE family metallo-endopeptidase n=1 Tax=Microbacterium dauci TaxID=3048008 RepID=A0ABT6ZAL3_9MICO|nr:ImmA/IrrE family metallo-endopeptidase [Microbacterium sp. LX3-4]MDJ1113201.1 ImmA/IrrE family metallo-endopeptidase [Microbacterium sp. LX3-4]
MRFAASKGIAVHLAHLEPGVLGEWYEDEREIFVSLALSPDEQTFTIAHELGHAHHAHQCEGDRDAEDEADLYAAQLLIDPEIYAQLEQQGHHQHDIAEHFGVTIDALNLWMQRCLTKLRGVTYVRAKMGTRQWSHRTQVA